MNSDQSEDLIKELCESGRIDDVLEEYILACSEKEARAENADALSDENSKRQKKQENTKASFPNLAGFCRYLGTGTEELSQLAHDYPSEYGRILAVLEDEALNSTLSPTLISAYLKKRLGYDSGASSTSFKNQLQIKFEHDIFEDGE